MKVILGLLLSVALVQSALACDKNPPPNCHCKNGQWISNITNKVYTSADAQAAAQAEAKATGGMAAGGDSTSELTNKNEVQGGNVGPVSAALNSTNETSNSGNYNYRESANAVQLATMIGQACGFGLQAGGSKTTGSAIFGIEITPEFCRDMIMASYEHSVGRVQAGCEIVQSTKEAQRVEKRLGHALPGCDAPPVTIIVQTPGTYTTEQVTEIVKKAVRK